MNKVKVVTGYIPLDIINISKEQFKADGDALLSSLPCPVKFFENWTIERCWLDMYLSAVGHPRVPSADVVPADRFPTPEIMLQSNIIQNQKSRWLELAAEEDLAPDVFIWIDYGIFKQKPMSAETVSEFILNVSRADVKMVTAPGIQPTPRRPDLGQFCDRFCGSVVVVPRDKVANYHAAMTQRAMIRITLHHKVEWEVNYMSDLEMDGFPIRQYQCWWDRSQMDNFPHA